MDRRTAIRNAILFSAGASLLPSCLQQEDGGLLPLKNIRVSSGQGKMMGMLAETILPTTAVPGAKELSSHLFTLMMVDDCFKKEEQENFVKGLQQFEEWVVKKTGGSFAKASLQQRDELVKEIECKKDIPDDIRSFYKDVKQLTIQSFTGSRWFLTTIRKYEMAPGRFHGCYPVTA